MVENIGKIRSKMRLKYPTGHGHCSFQFQQAKQIAFSNYMLQDIKEQAVYLTGPWVAFSLHMELTLVRVPVYSKGMICSPNLTYLLRGTVIKNEPSILFVTTLDWKWAHLKWLNTACMWISPLVCLLLLVSPLFFNKIGYSTQADHLWGVWEKAACVFFKVSY